jgi:uncharacterized protein YkwD
MKKIFNTLTPGRYIGLLLAFGLLTGLTLALPSKASPVPPKIVQTPFVATKPTEPVKTETPPAVGGVDAKPLTISISRALPSVDDILAGINQMRAEAGVAPLETNGVLQTSAKLKANDLCTDNYWSHVNPNTGAHGYEYMEQLGYWGLLGENLAHDYWTADSVNLAWRNSPGHYANIINPGYKFTGISVIDCPSYLGAADDDIIVEHFQGDM